MRIRVFWDCGLGGETFAHGHRHPVLWQRPVVHRRPYSPAHDKSARATHTQNRYTYSSNEMRNSIITICRKLISLREVLRCLRFSVRSEGGVSVLVPGHVSTYIYATLAACLSWMCRSFEPASCAGSSSPRHRGGRSIVQRIMRWACMQESRAPTRLVSGGGKLRWYPNGASIPELRSRAL
jgi:hypothetical protein